MPQRPIAGRSTPTLLSANCIYLDCLAPNFNLRHGRPNYGRRVRHCGRVCGIDFGGTVGSERLTARVVSIASGKGAMGLATVSLSGVYTNRLLGARTPSAGGADCAAAEADDSMS